MLEKDFFNPKSIAVIGASSHPEKIGFSVLKNIIDGGYQGRIFPVNLDADNILGLKCYGDVLSTPGKVDLAVIVVPAEIVEKVLAECGRKKIKFAIIISAGFAEIGGEGTVRQTEIVKIAERYGIRVLGPNCLGVIDPVNKLNISFATNLPKKKNIAVISQSGATCTAILDWANYQGVGFSRFISLGNKVDLNENDFLNYLHTDPETKVILGYLESFSDGKEFLKLAEEVTIVKPFILLKSGKSVAGQKTASSHTGALASDDRVVGTALNEAGVIRADTIQDLFEWSLIFSELKIPKSNKILVMTNAGGPAVMTADAIASSTNLDFYEFNPEEKRTLKRQAAVGATISNPLDLLGDATSDRFGKALATVGDNPDLKLILLTPQSNTDAEKIASTIVERNDKKTVVVLLGGKRFNEAWNMLTKHHIPVFAYPERAILALDTLVRYQNLKKCKIKDEKYVRGFKKVAEKELASAPQLTDNNIAKILTAYSIPMAHSALTTCANEAITQAEKIGYPVVLKVTSPDILHKTEIGAVRLNINNAGEIRSSYQELLKNAKKHFPKAKILGVSVYKMLTPKIEIALGAKRDEIFGPVIMFGLGGVNIELLADYSLGLAPIGEKKALEMIKSIKSYKLLDGFRNGDKYDLAQVAKAISGLSALMTDFSEIAEVDINPLTFDRGKLLALDAKIIFEKEAVCDKIDSTVVSNIV